MLLGVLQVREQRLGLVGRADLDVLADGQVIDRREEDRVAHDAGDRVDDQLIRAGAVDDAGAASVDVARGGGAVTAAAAARGGGDGLGGHLVGTLGGGAVTAAAAAGRGFDGLSGHLVGALGGCVVATAAAATGRGFDGLSGLGAVAVAAAAAATLLSGGLRGGLLGARLLAFAAAAATAAAVLGGDGVGVDQLEHLTVSHVFSFILRPDGPFQRTLSSVGMPQPRPRVHLMRNSASTSTLTLRGSAATPTALRACWLPKISPNSSEAPLMTPACP